MHAALAIAAKDLKQLFRDRGGLFFIVAFPIIYALFFGSIFSGASDGNAAKISVGVADMDRSEASGKLVETLRGNKDLAVTVFASKEAALDAVRGGKQTACLVIPEGFSEKGMFTGQPADLELGVDPSHKAEGGMLQGIVIQSAFERMQDLFADPNMMNSQIDKALASMKDSKDMSQGVRATLEPFLGSVKAFSRDMDKESKNDPKAKEAARAGFQPVNIREIPIAQAPRAKGPANTFAITFPQAAIWGVMGATAGFGISLVTERSKGTMVRLKAAPIPHFSVLLGKAIACFLTVIGVILMLLVFARLVFHLSVGSPGLLAVAMLCTGVCFVGLMMLLASIAKTERAAGGIGWAVMTVLAMLGGGMIPLFFMPAWMQPLSSVSPMKWAILSMEGAVWRGFTPGQMLLPCGVLLGIGAAGMLIGTTTLSRADA